MTDDSIHMAVPEYFLKIDTSLSADRNTFLLNVNGQSVWRLPYKFQLQDQHDTQDELQAGEVKFNGIEI